MQFSKCSCVCHYDPDYEYNYQHVHCSCEFYKGQINTDRSICGVQLEDRKLVKILMMMSGLIETIMASSVCVL